MEVAREILRRWTIQRIDGIRVERKEFWHSNDEIAGRSRHLAEVADDRVPVITVLEEVRAYNYISTASELVRQHRGSLQVYSDIYAGCGFAIHVDDGDASMAQRAKDVVINVWLVKSPKFFSR